MHKDHRKHTKDRFLAEGLDSFEPHEILELLLFYSIPQRDTNGIAHELINRFGSLSAVLDAPYEDLLDVPGISEHSATLIKLIPAISRRYALEKNSKVTRLATIEDIGRYLVARYLGVTEETVENMRRLIGVADVIVPNLTEAEFLTDEYFEAWYQSLCDALSQYEG